MIEFFGRTSALRDEPGNQFFGVENLGIDRRQALTVISRLLNEQCVEISFRKDALDEILDLFLSCNLANILDIAAYCNLRPLLPTQALDF